MHGRSHIKFGLHVRHMGVTKIDTVGLEKGLGIQIVCPK